MSMSRDPGPSHLLPLTRGAPRLWPVLSLPAEVAPFIGRHREIDAVRALLYRPTTRLLTIVGAGGVGKTRLAMRAAAGLDVDQRRFDAVHFVSLGSVTQPEMVMVAIGLALGVPDGGRVPLKDGVGLAVQSLDVMLILDTFEHLRAARTTVTDLLTACPTLTVVVTSRVPLRVYGEQIYRLAPMALGESRGEGDVADAVRLFVERGRAVRDDFELTAANREVVSDICTRLDGLPLAIELAAARLSVLTPTALRDRLDPCLPLLTRAPGDAPARQRTQRATIAWSYDLLDTVEQEILRLLASCAGGFGLPVFEALLADYPQLEALAVLEELVEANLVHQEPVGGELRYRLLDTVREFGQDEAARRNETARLAERHARGLLAWTMQVEPHLYNRYHLARWLDGLTLELLNVRQALAWFDRHDPAGLAQFSTALGQFWLRKSMLAEGRHWAERALEAMGPVPSVERGRALVDLGRMLMYQLDDRDAAVQHEAYQIALALDDRGLQVQVLIGQLTRCLIRGDRVAAPIVMQALDELQPFIVASGGSYLRETVLALEALGAAMLGQTDRIDALAAASLAVQSAPDDAGKDSVLAICRRAQALAALQRGDAPRALWLFQDSLRQYTAFGEQWMSALVMVEIGVVVQDWAPQVTAYFYGAADRVLGLLGLHGPFAEHPVHGVVQAEVMERLGPVAWRPDYEAGHQAATATAIDRALNLSWPVTIPAPVRTLPRTPTGQLLTPRELDVLTLLADGLTDREIGQKLGIRYRTTTTFVTRILTKLDVPSRTAAATTALRLGIVPGRATH